MGRVDAGDLLRRARAEFAPDPGANRVVPLVESGEAAPALLRALAAEERAVVAADRRAFLRLAERAAAMPACAAYYAELARGEEEAALRLDAFARAVDALPDPGGDGRGDAHGSGGGDLAVPAPDAAGDAGDADVSAPAALPGETGGTGAAPEGHDAARPRGPDGHDPGSGRAPERRGPAEGPAGAGSGGRTAGGQGAGGRTPDGQESGDPGPGDRVPAEQRRGGGGPAEQRPGDRVPIEQRRGGGGPAEQRPGDQGPAEQRPGGGPGGREPGRHSPGAPAEEAYELRAGCQAYPAFVAWLAINAAPAGTVLALAANFSAWGGYCSRIARGLREHYGLDDAACAFFDLFAEPAPAYEESVVAAVQEWADAGRIDEAAVRRHGRLLRSYEAGFWDALLER
ncbi:hypothetical protein [Streptomyces sp. NPDC056600]|uniref:hypothetical protein n=1 Tax=Streptomyces sp. NPDC056600 TaxID=3345874 RepID=UPI0036CF2F75